MQNAWTLSIDSQWIAWLTFDMPGEKVNTFTEQSLHQLNEILNQVVDDETIKALIIKSGKPDSFIAGADIDELAKISTTDDAKEKAEAGHAVFAKLAALEMPTIAVINGACMGGGLEMALACDYRLVTDNPKTKLVLPEVNLGILPGWGGTQRLPRLIGLPAALPMILSGKPADKRKAYRSGLVDGVIAPEFLEEHVIRFVDKIVKRSGKRQVKQRRKRCQPLMMRLLSSFGLGRRLIFHKAHKQIMEKTKGVYPAPLKALQVVKNTASGKTLAEGFKTEIDAFSQLACTSISRNLVWLFQASQRAKKIEGSKKVAITKPQSAGVLGAGIMGGGIAWALSNAGLQVRMRDLNWTALGSGMAAAAKMNRAMVKRRKMTENEMNLAMHRIAPTVDYHGFADLDFVIEAVAEDLQLKRKVLAELEDHIRPDTIICTNTSSLRLIDIASALKHPERFVGMHFFNPVNRMPLVEIVSCKKTSQTTIVAAAELVKSLGKIPVIVGDCAGFLVNRILLPYLVESAWMFEEGVDIERIDRVLEKFGMPMGPLALVDEVGLDVGYKVAKILEEAYGERMHVPAALGHVVDCGDLLGKKNGSGFYLYNNGQKKPNPKVSNLTASARQQDQISARELSDEQILDRAILIMVNEAARCIDEGVVKGPEQLDLAMVMGTGFAPFRGGLLHYADERGVGEIKQRLDELAIAFGDRFTPAPLLEKIASNGGRFYQNEAA
ncbi:MAG: enoyl-CoA hydratase/isomerase family protein [Planctomycetes bacterium]|nr:enoyl-CoA hydratase/isomerase family protein [Planctomycetota bacterium]